MRFVRFSTTAVASMQSLFVDYSQGSKTVVTVDISKLDREKPELDVPLFGSIVTDPGPKGGNILATQMPA